MGGASRDSTGFVLMEEGLISVEAGTSGSLSISDSDRSVPAELGLDTQASYCLRKGTPLASLVV